MPIANTIAAKTNSLKSTVGAFVRNESGTFGIMFAACSIMLTMAVGFTVDVARVMHAESKLSYAVDAAVTSTTRNISLGLIPLADAEKRLRDSFAVNIDEKEFLGGTAKLTNIKINTSKKTVSAEAFVDLPMTIMRIAGYESRKIATSSAALFSDTKIEVAMALDVTGSMSDKISGSTNTKMGSLKKAASAGVDALIPNASAAKRVRIGLVPYAATVDASPVISRIETVGASDGCVFERTGTNAHTDAFANYANPVGGTKSYCPNAKILPLTNNVTKLKAHINSFSTGGCTAGHTAIAWAHYMLSPNWNKAWPTGSKVVNYGGDARKYAIIMTDGIFNTHISSGDVCNNEGKAASRTDALALCSSMKAKGIKVYTIAFAAPSDAAKLMDDCATDKDGASDYYFNATDEAGLISAFEAIAKDIQTLRITS